MILEERQRSLEHLQIQYADSVQQLFNEQTYSQELNLKLNETSQKLQYTTLVLNEEKEIRQDTEAVRDEHQNAEALLRKEATYLIQQLQTTLMEVRSLHHSVESRFFLIFFKIPSSI